MPVADSRGARLSGQRSGEPLPPPSPPPPKGSDQFAERGSDLHSMSGTRRARTPRLLSWAGVFSSHSLSSLREMGFPNRILRTNSSCVILSRYLAFLSLCFFTSGMGVIKDYLEP